MCVYIVSKNFFVMQKDVLRFDKCDSTVRGESKTVGVCDLGWEKVISARAR